MPESVPFFPAQIYDNASKSNARWKAFLVTEQLKHAPAELGDIAEAIERFLKVPLEAIKNETDFPKEWQAPGPWK